MATRYQYKILQLQEQPGHANRVFVWASQCGCHHCAPEELDALLNRLGAEGWAAAVLGASDRCPHSLILSRVVPDEVPGGASPVAAHALAPNFHNSHLEPDPHLPALVAEVQALRAELAARPAPQVTCTPPPVTVLPTPVTVEAPLVQVAPPVVNVEALAPQLEALLAALRRIEAGQPALARAVERLLEDALTPRLLPAVPLTREPTSVPWWHFFRRFRPVGSTQ